MSRFEAPTAVCTQVWGMFLDVVCCCGRLTGCASLVAAVVACICFWGGWGGVTVVVSVFGQETCYSAYECLFWVGWLIG